MIKRRSGYWYDPARMTVTEYVDWLVWGMYERNANASAAFEDFLLKWEAFELKKWRKYRSEKVWKQRMISLLDKLGKRKDQNNDK